MSHFSLASAITLPSFSSLWLISTFIYLSSSVDAQTGFYRCHCNLDNYYADGPAFYANLNATFADIRSALTPATRFITRDRATRSSEPVYGMFQCRPYLSYAECLTCFDTLFSLTFRTCQTRRGSITFTDSCYLRYGPTNFYADLTDPGHVLYCDDPSAAEAGDGFALAAESALKELVDLAPKEDGMFAAGRKAAGDATVYAVRQCMPTVGAAGCGSCLQAAVKNLVGCLPGAGGRVVEYGCFLRFSGLEFFNRSYALDLDHVAAKSGTSSNMTPIIGGAIGAAAVLICMVLLFVCLRQRKETEFTWAGNIEGLTELRGPTTFSYNDLKSATRNFDEENKLGQGGFSTVYKGLLGNGKVVAVKKLEISETMEARSNFESEVILISNIYHRNLARLLGCCRKGPHLLLVYEYMEKGSLDKYLYGGKRGTLNWKQLYDIILGTARGLAYLHEEFHVRIIHRDIKPGNILLDDEFQPKVADFGLARLLPENSSQVRTRLAGTLGYAAPEYVIKGQLSEKVDTFSYGVVVLEILSGRRSNDLTADAAATYLLEWAWRLYESDMLMDLVDKTLDLSGVEAEEARKVMEIGLMCTQSAPLRPAMSKVMDLLVSKDPTEFQLSRPAFMRELLNRTDTEPSCLSGSSTSNANMTISVVSGR